MSRDIAVFPSSTYHQITSTSFSLAPSQCFSQQTPSHCGLLLPSNMALLISTTYLHVTSITSLSWVSLRIAFHSKRLRAAPFLCHKIWQCFSLQLTFTSLPSQFFIEFTFALHITENAFWLRLTYVKRYGSVSLYSLPSHYSSQQAPSRCALILSREMAVCLATTHFHITSITSLSWVYLRIAFHSKRLHAAPCLCQEIWQLFSLKLTFTSPPS